MYTKKLLKTNLTVGSVFGMAVFLFCIITVFRFISFQDAKQDIDEMISDHGVLTAEDKDKIDLFQPTLFMILGGSLAFGAAVYVQMFMMSLQMNVSRKHLNIANLISQVVFSVFIVGTFVAGQICSGLLFSELCKDKYEWLSGKYRDMMFDLRLSGRSMAPDQRHFSLRKQKRRQGRRGKSCRRAERSACETCDRRDHWRGNKDCAG